jgi:hypothetical protein
MGADGEHIGSTILTVHKKRDIRTVIIAGALKTMTKSPLKLVAPATVNRTVTMPRRKPNSVYRTREHLTGAEVDRLIDAAKANRWGHRDATMILVAFRHGLQAYLGHRNIQHTVRYTELSSTRFKDFWRS